MPLRPPLLWSAELHYERGALKRFRVRTHLQCCAGIPEAFAASNGADTAVCVLLMSTFAAFAFPNSSVAVRGLHLPISLAAGVCIGLLAGALCSWRLIWRSAQQRAAVMLLLGQALAFLGCAVLCGHLMGDEPPSSLVSSCLW